MPYAKTPVGTVPTSEAVNGPEIDRHACESGYPAHVSPELRPFRGVMVGLAVASVFYGLVGAIAWLA